MNRVFHSRVYGAMNKRRRQQLGLARFPREQVWAKMRAEEERLAEAVRRRPLAWWQRLLLRLRAVIARLRRL
jgi:hypothetical protein